MMMQVELVSLVTLTIQEAANEAGVRTPHLCSDPPPAPTGAYRLCVGEIEGERGLQTSCTRQVSPGMIVHASTENTHASRTATLEMLLSEHRVACTTCDMDGGCLLQDYAYEYQASETSLPNIALPCDLTNYSSGSEAIAYDPSKCVRCQLCVRFCEEIQMVEALTLRGRSGQVEVTTGIDGELNESTCESSGGCVNVRPPGARVGRWDMGLGRAKQLEKVRTTC